MSDTMATDVDAPPRPQIEVPRQTGAGGPTGSSPALRMVTKKLNFWYGPKQALYNISLKIP
jgi:hypothetical protein